MNCVSISPIIYITSEYTNIHWCYWIDTQFRGVVNSRVWSRFMVWKQNGKSLINQTNAKSLGYKYAMTRLTHAGSWQLRRQKTSSSQCQWKYQLVVSSNTFLLIMSSTTVNVFYYQMNFIGIQQRIYLKFLQQKRSTGQGQIFVIVSILPRAEYQLHLQISSVDMNWVLMILIEKCQIFPLEYPKTWWWTDQSETSGLG